MIKWDGREGCKRACVVEDMWVRGEGKSEVEAKCWSRQQEQ
jgi:hypothetical protein